ncbi:hypothetical protein [Bacteroides heparinolyticus]|uniref:hypothetical protein n=1 Tax=Prevotella heparinolytica TaxID=28113 RepID=UPI00359F5AEA
MMTRNEFAYKAHKNAQEKGFWKERLSNEHYLMLVVTEIAEAIEADRKDERANLMGFDIGLKNAYKGVVRDDWFLKIFRNLKGSLEDEIADIAIRLADLAGALGLDFDKMKPCNYHRAFDKFSFTENAFALTKWLSCDKIDIERRILFGLDYVFSWAESLNIDLWFFIEQKMKYNALRPALHGKKY